MIDPLLNGDAVPEAQQQAKNGSSGCEPFFESGEAAMSIEVRGNLPGLQTAIGSKFAYNVVAMPSITAANGKQVIPTGGGSLGWCLAPGQTHNTLALAFLKYLFSPAGQVVAEKTFGVVPAEPSNNGPMAIWRTQSGGPANSSAYVTAAATATIAPPDAGHRIHAFEHRRPGRRHRCDDRTRVHREGVHEPAEPDAVCLHAERLAHYSAWLIEKRCGDGRLET